MCGTKKSWPAPFQPTPISPRLTSPLVQGSHRSPELHRPTFTTPPSHLHLHPSSGRLRVEVGEADGMGPIRPSRRGGLKCGEPSLRVLSAGDVRSAAEPATSTRPPVSSTLHPRCG
jgi:hypothetical protein